MEREINENLFIPRDSTSSFCFTTHHDSPSHVCFFLFDRIDVFYTELYYEQSSKQLCVMGLILHKWTIFCSRVQAQNVIVTFSFWKDYLFSQAGNKSLWYRAFLGNLDSINSCSVEHPKYQSTRSSMSHGGSLCSYLLIWPLCQCPVCCSPPQCVSGDSPQLQAWRDCTFSTPGFTAGLGLFFWTWIQRGVLTFLGMYLCWTSSRRWSKA